MINLEKTTALCQRIDDLLNEEGAMPACIVIIDIKEGKGNKDSTGRTITAFNPHFRHCQCSDCFNAVEAIKASVNSCGLLGQPNPEPIQ